jgi:hypothetical protein
VSLNLTPPRRGCPIFPRPIAERWEPKISTSARHPLLKQDKASRFPRLNYPPLKKPKGRPASRCHPEEAESRTRDSQRRISALSPANQCRRERPRLCGPKQICHPERSRATLCLSISPPPSKRVPHLSAFCAERWEPRISTSARHPFLKQDKASRFPRLNYPPLKKPKGRPASRCHPEEAESRTRDSQRRISALSPANQ